TDDGVLSASDRTRKSVQHHELAVGVEIRLRFDAVELAPQRPCLIRDFEKWRFSRTLRIERRRQVVPIDPPFSGIDSSRDQLQAKAPSHPFRFNVLLRDVSPADCAAERSSSADLRSLGGAAITTPNRKRDARPIGRRMSLEPNAVTCLLREPRRR